MVRQATSVFKAFVFSLHRHVARFHASSYWPMFVFSSYKCYLNSRTFFPPTKFVSSLFFSRRWWKKFFRKFLEKKFHPKTCVRVHVNIKSEVPRTNNVYLKFSTGFLRWKLTKIERKKSFFFLLCLGDMLKHFKPIRSGRRRRKRFIVSFFTSFGKEV